MTGPLRRARRRKALAAALAVLLALNWIGAAAQDEEGRPQPFAFEVAEINAGLAPASPPLQLDTPRAALESYLDAIRRKQFPRAAHALNLNAFPPEEQADRAPTLALMLAFVLRRHNLIGWSEIPDQPDARVLPGVQQSVSPYSRRSVQLGEVDLEGRPVPISLQRFRATDGEAVWLFSPFAVERISQMYDESRPGLLSHWVPLERRLETLGRPSRIEWLVAGLLLLLAGAIWLAVHSLTRFASRRLRMRWSRPVRKAALPLATVVAVGLFGVATSHLFLLTGPVASGLGTAAEVIALIAGVWLLLQAVSLASRALSERYVVPLSTDDPENRRTKTTVYLIRRISLVVVALLSLAYILVRSGLFESFGLSILASAGALGVLVAIAARPLLGNLVSGLQIAMTDPVRIGDVVVYGEYWATVEDISFAHTVLRTWTDTRLIVPHSDFLARPFENWSKEGEAVWRIVKLPVDFRVPVDRIRQKVAEIVEGDPRTTNEPPRVELVEATPESAVIWVWVHGWSALSSWTLHNDVREGLVAFVRELDGGAYLPRRRHSLIGDAGGRIAEGGGAPDAPSGS